MLCPDCLLALRALWLQQGEATCNRLCGAGLPPFVALLKLLRWTCGNGAAAASSRATYGTSNESSFIPTPFCHQLYYLQWQNSLK